MADTGISLHPINLPSLSSGFDSGRREALRAQPGIRINTGERGAFEVTAPRPSFAAMLVIAALAVILIGFATHGFIDHEAYATPSTHQQEAR